MEAVRVQYSRSFGGYLLQTSGLLRASRLKKNQARLKRSLAGSKKKLSKAEKKTGRVEKRFPGLKKSFEVEKKLFPLGCGSFQEYGKTPQIIHFNRVWNHYKFYPFWGAPIFGNIHVLPRCHTILCPFS